MRITAIDDVILSWMDRLLQFAWQEFGWTRTWICRASVGIAMMCHVYISAMQKQSTFATLMFALWAAFMIGMHYTRVERKLGLAPDVLNKYLLALRESESTLRILLVAAIFIFDVPVVLSEPSNVVATTSSLFYFFISVAFVPMEPREPKTKLVFQT